MKSAAQIRKYIANTPEGATFPSSALRPFASTENIRQILGRLVKAGELTRVARGVFAKPKYLSMIGEILPPASEVAATLAKSTGEIITVHGAEAARQLQLTTQVPMRLIFYTSGNTRTLKIANRTVKLQHVNPSKLVAPGTTPGLVVCALDYLGRENVTIDTLKTIKQRISSEEFNATLHLTERMPAWMSDIFYRFQQEKTYE